MNYTETGGNPVMTCREFRPGDDRAPATTLDQPTGFREALAPAQVAAR